MLDILKAVGALAFLAALCMTMIIIISWWDDD